MAVIRTIPSKRIIGGKIVESSEIALVSEPEYNTLGENCVIVRGVSESIITLNSTYSEHIVVKSMTRITIRPDLGLIDEEYNEIQADKFACIEFRFVGGNWYILSSDGLKQS
jgi:hypothetical protein